MVSSHAASVIEPLLRHIAFFKIFGIGGVFINTMDTLKSLTSAIASEINTANRYHQGSFLNADHLLRIFWSDILATN